MSWLSVSHSCALEHSSNASAEQRPLKNDDESERSHFWKMSQSFTPPVAPPNTPTFTPHSCELSTGLFNGQVPSLMANWGKNATYGARESSPSYTASPQMSPAPNLLSKVRMSNENSQPRPLPCRGCTEQCPNREECLGAPWRKDMQEGGDVRLAASDPTSQKRQ